MTYSVNVFVRNVEVNPKETRSKTVFSFFVTIKKRTDGDVIFTGTSDVPPDDVLRRSFCLNSEHSTHSLDFKKIYFLESSTSPLLYGVIVEDRRYLLSYHVIDCTSPLSSGVIVDHGRYLSLDHVIDYTSLLLYAVIVEHGRYLSLDHAIDCTSPLLCGVIVEDGRYLLYNVIDCTGQ